MSKLLGVPGVEGLCQSFRDDAGQHRSTSVDTNLVALKQLEEVRALSDPTVLAPPWSSG